MILLGALALGLILGVLWPVPLFGRGLAARVEAGSLILAGLVLSGAVMHHFGRAGTPVTPWDETRRLVVSDPYRFSRNPDYVDQTLIVAGLVLLFRVPWLFVTLVPALLLVRYGVIASALTQCKRQAVRRSSIGSGSIGVAVR